MAKCRNYLNDGTGGGEVCPGTTIKLYANHPVLAHTVPVGEWCRTCGDSEVTGYSNSDYVTNGAKFATRKRV